MKLQNDIELIKYLIFHYTGMKSDKLAISKLTNFNSKVSCHYYIDKDGNITQLVPDLYVAWHAGISFWKGDKSLNKRNQYRIYPEKSIYNEIKLND